MISFYFPMSAKGKCILICVFGNHGNQKAHDQVLTCKYGNLHFVSFFLKYSNNRMNIIQFLIFTLTENNFMTVVCDLYDKIYIYRAFKAHCVSKILIFNTNKAYL